LVPSEKMRLMEIAVLKARAEADKKAKEEAAALALTEAFEEEEPELPVYEKLVPVLPVRPKDIFRMEEKENAEDNKEQEEEEIEEGEGSVTYEEEDESW